jgi:glutamate carboxypeptidase
VQSWTNYFRDRLTEILEEIKTYVEYETPTHDKAAVDELGRLIVNRFEALGCKVSEYPQTQYGNQLRIEYGEGERQILVLGHFDTVKDKGTLVTEPWRIEDGKAYGPGVFDMKAGIVFAYFALKAIIETKVPLSKKLVFFWNTDEETGSHSSRGHIEEEAKKSDVALILEPAFGSGALKTSRKSGGEFTLKVYGRAAHAGNDHALGVNAIEEMAHQILKIQSFTDYGVGTTLSVGTIQGGTASNVVPDYAEAQIDARVSQMAEAARVTDLMYGLTPVHPQARLEVSGGFNKLPLERTADVERLFYHAQAQAELEGFTLSEASVGGTSDGNITAAVGTPTLDGLGPVGDGAHAVHEHIVIDEIPNRIALLLRLMTTL